jgi:hypothetical protein
MDDVFDGPEEKVPSEGEAQVEQPVTESPPEPAAPPAADTEKHVPLAALEAERAGRRDWKEKALRSEGEIKSLREQLARTAQQPQEPRQPADPLQQAAEFALSERLNTSEMLAREKFGDAAVDEAFAKFQEAQGKDPSLHQRVMSQKHPWGALVKEMQRAALLDEIGDDPAAYKERLKAELLAPPVSTPKPVLPTSLAGARSSAGRTSPGVTGPPSFKELF